MASSPFLCVFASNVIVNELFLLLSMSVSWVKSTSRNSGVKVSCFIGVVELSSFSIASRWFSLGKAQKRRCTVKTKFREYQFIVFSGDEWPVPDHDLPPEESTHISTFLSKSHQMCAFVRSQIDHVNYLQIFLPRLIVSSSSGDSSSPSFPTHHH